MAAPSAPTRDAGAVATVDALASHWADVNETDEVGETLLYTAVREGHEAEALVLLEKYGADPNATDGRKRVPLHRAKSATMVAALVLHGADVHSNHAAGDTPLHHALTAEVADALVEHGASVHAQTDFGWTPLHMAVECQRYGVVAVLLEKHNADPTATDKSGDTPLHGAQSVDVVNALVKHGADVHAVTLNGMSPLYVSVFYGRDDVSMELLEMHGANSSHADKDGDTPLHIVTSPVVADSLLEHGADLKACNKKGRTPVDTAANSKVAAVLARHTEAAARRTKAARV